MDKWYLSLNYQETKEIIGEKIENIRNNFIAIGFFLKQIRDNKTFEEDGYKSIYEFAEDIYGITRSTTSRWMDINDKFSEGGNSPELAAEYKEYGKSQLQEMLYLDNKQLEEVNPDMTVREIKEIRKPEPEKKISTIQRGCITGKSPHGNCVCCGANGVKCCSECEEGCNGRCGWLDERSKCKFDDKIECTAEGCMEVAKSLGLECKVSCCQECDESCGARCRYSALSDKVDVCDVAQTENVCPEEERLPGQMKIYDYPDVCPEEGKPIRATTILTYIVDSVLDWFDVERIAREHSGEQFIKEVKDELYAEAVSFTFCNTELEAVFLSEIKVAKKSTEQEITQYTWEQFFEELEYIGEVNEQYAEENIIPDAEPVIDSTCSVIKEEPEELFEEQTEDNDLDIARKELDKANRMLNDMLECYTENDFRVRKQKILVAALASYSCDLDNILNPPPAPAQPELPVLKNMEQREEFILNYKTWPVWCKNEKTEETYYRYDLLDGSSIVVREYPYNLGWRNEERTGKELFLLDYDTKHFKDGETNMTTLKEHLKEVQKHGR